MKIDDKVAIVTGASSGIGRATAELFGKNGAKAALAARSIDKLEEISASITDSFIVPVDMTKLVEDGAEEARSLWPSGCSDQQCRPRVACTGRGHRLG